MNQNPSTSRKEAVQVKTIDQDLIFFSPYGTILWLWFFYLNVLEPYVGVITRWVCTVTGIQHTHTHTQICVNTQDWCEIPGGSFASLVLHMCIWCKFDLMSWIEMLFFQFSHLIRTLHQLCHFGPWQKMLVCEYCSLCKIVFFSVEPTLHTAVADLLSLCFFQDSYRSVLSP